MLIEKFGRTVSILQVSIIYEQSDHATYKMTFLKENKSTHLQKEKFKNCIITRREAVNWPQKSFDLTGLVFFEVFGNSIFTLIISQQW